MRFSYLRSISAIASLFTLLSASGDASATNITEFPDNGSEQMGRGGAWVARASDPLAVAFNPAGLAGQRTALTLQANLTMHDVCFTRLKAANDTTQEDVQPGQTYPKVCADKGLFPNPQLAFNYRVNERIGVALAVLGPSGVGAHKWPTFIEANGQQQPAPERYLLLEAKSTFLTPTIGAGVEVAEGLRLGASFTWGFIKAKFSNASAALNQDNLAPRSNDIDATIIVADYFVPGFRLGGLYSPTEFFDVGVFYKWSDSVKASGDAYTRANYYTPNVAAGNKSGVVDGDTSLSDCNLGPSSAGVCGSGKNAALKLAVPMEARIGFRYHQPRAKVAPAPAYTPEGSEAAATPAVVLPKPEKVRDPIADDLFDAELDFTWANNSAFDNLEIRFPANAQGGGLIPVNGTPGVIPPNADVPHNYKDVLGIRLGGDVNVLPNQLALRAGGYFESKGQADRFQNTDFVGGSRIGIAAGGTYRVPIGKMQLDLMLGFMHVFVSEQKNNGPDGITGLAGTACNQSTPVTGAEPCAEGRTRYRTNWPVNLGTITNAFNVFNLGANMKF